MYAQARSNALRRRFQTPRDKLGDAADRMPVRELGEDVGKMGGRIVPVEIRNFDRRRRAFFCTGRRCLQLGDSVCRFKMQFQARACGWATGVADCLCCRIQWSPYSDFRPLLSEAAPVDFLWRAGSAELRQSFSGIALALHQHGTRLAARWHRIYAESTPQQCRGFNPHLTCQLPAYFRRAFRIFSLVANLPT